MTTIADAPSGAISYAEWLQGKIADRLNGVQTDCGPDVYDFPTISDRLGLTAASQCRPGAPARDPAPRAGASGQAGGHARSRGGNRDVTARADASCMPERPGDDISRYRGALPV